MQLLQAFKNIATTLLACTHLKSMFKGGEPTKVEFKTFVFTPGINVVNLYEFLYPDDTDAGKRDYIKFYASDKITDVTILHNKQFSYVGGFVKKTVGGQTKVCRFYNREYNSARDGALCASDGAFYMIGDNFGYARPNDPTFYLFQRSAETIKRDVPNLKLPIGVDETNGVFIFLGKDNTCSEVLYTGGLWRIQACMKRDIEGTDDGRSVWYSLRFLDLIAPCGFDAPPQFIENTYVRFVFYENNTHIIVAIILSVIGIVMILILVPALVLFFMKIRKEYRARQTQMQTTMGTGAGSLVIPKLTNSKYRTEMSKTKTKLTNTQRKSDTKQSKAKTTKHTKQTTKTQTKSKKGTKTQKKSSTRISKPSTHKSGSQPDNQSNQKEKVPEKPIMDLSEMFRQPPSHRPADPPGINGYEPLDPTEVQRRPGHLQNQTPPFNL